MKYETIHSSIGFGLANLICEILVEDNIPYKVVDVTKDDKTAMLPLFNVLVPVDQVSQAHISIERYKLIALLKNGNLE